MNVLNFFKLGFLAMVFLCQTETASITNDTATTVSESDSCTISTIGGGGTIIVEIDGFTAESEIPSSQIKRVELTGTPGSYTIEGCGGSKCFYSTSKIPNGVYHVKAICSSGNFSATIELK